MVQVARGVGVGGDEGGDVLCHSSQDRQDDVVHHFWRREGVEVPMVHRRQAQPVFARQGESPFWLQLESQVGDGVRRRYPVPWVVQVWADAQLQARNLLRGGHGALAGVEPHAHHPEVRGHRLHALDEVLQHVGHHKQVVYIGLDKTPFGLSRRAQAVPLDSE